MKFRALVAMVSLIAGSSGAVASPPMPKGGVIRLAPRGKPALVHTAARPLAAAFGSALFPDPNPALRFGNPFHALTARLPRGYEVVVFAPHRPIRARVNLLYEGKTLTHRWEQALRSAFKGFDRDGDGALNGHETRYIFSDASLSQLIQSGYYAPNPKNLPTLDKLDMDRDRRVSFEEFAAYYQKAASSAARPFPPAEENPFNTPTTEAIFKLIDQNGDGKLARSEVAALERLISSRDANEDECLSQDELIDRNNNPRSRAPAVPYRPRVPKNVAVYPLGLIPGAIITRIIKDRDRDNDFELTMAESGFDRSTFDRLDADHNGRLTGEELDQWRFGKPDLEATLSLSNKSAECRATIATEANRLADRGFTVKAIEPSRVVVHHGRQSIEFWAFAPPARNGRGLSIQPAYAAMFQQLAGKKGYIQDRDFTGTKALQYQQIRVLVEPADFNSDGKLTRAEFDKYFELQQPFADIGLGFIPTVQTPTLFQLLDEDPDGRLGVRELRSAWSRLAALEPPGPGGRVEAITRQALQPAVSLCLARALYRGIINQRVFTNPDTIRVPTKGPEWFRKMDRNGDGDVSRAEFLGGSGEFTTIDADRDSLISLDEAEAFEKKARKKGK